MFPGRENQIDLNFQLLVSHLKSTMTQQFLGEILTAPSVETWGRAVLGACEGARAADLKLQGLHDTRQQ